MAVMGHRGAAVLDVLQAVERLAPFPQSGRIVPEMNDPMIREIPLGNYRIVYRVRGERVDVLAVYHGARLLDPDSLRSGTHPDP